VPPVYSATGLISTIGLATPLLWISFFSDVDTLAKRVREAMAEQVVFVFGVCGGGSGTGGGQTMPISSNLIGWCKLNRFQSDLAAIRTNLYIQTHIYI
jgi:hypothetical protein